jgi:hypothetical protein
LKYASSPYPPLYISAPSINFNTKTGAAWSDGNGGGSYGTTAMTITGPGSVGIGTTAPINKLDVNGGVAVGTQYAGIAAPTSGMIVQGNVGIGVTNPSSQLQTSGTASFGSMYLNSADAFGDRVLENSSSNLSVIAGSARIFLQNSTGKVGIGTTSPPASFDLSQTTDALALPIGTQGQEPASPLNGMIRYSTTAGDLEAYIAGAWTTLTTGGDNAAIYLGTSASNTNPQRNNDGTTGLFSPVGTSVAVAAAGSEMMRVNGTGVGIGTTSPSYLLHVGSPTAVGVVADFQNSSGYCTFNPSSSGIMTTCTSDVRLKKDIVDAKEELPYLTSMRLREYTLRATGERRTGVIAQEMMQVHPEMVHMGATGFYQVDVPDAWKLIKAIQELKADNDNLAASLKAANNNIAELRASFETYKQAHP